MRVPITRDVDEEDDADDELQGSEVTRYRAMAARISYLSQDRVDVQFVAKEACRGMSKPKMKDYRKLKRLARYLIQHPRLGGSRFASNLLGAICVAVRLQADLAYMGPPQRTRVVAIAMFGEVEANLLAFPCRRPEIVAMLALLLALSFSFACALAGRRGSFSLRGLPLLSLVFVVPDF